MWMNGGTGTWFRYIQGLGGVLMCHPAGEDCPREPVAMGQTKVALDAELSIWASDGFTSVVVQQFLGVTRKPSDANRCRAEAEDQAHKFTRALEQGG